MSAIGRLFIVLNLILSAVFLGSVSGLLASGSDYKQQLEDEQAAHAATQELVGKEKADLAAQIDQLEQARTQLAGERDDLKADADRFKEDLDAQKRNADQLRADLSGIKDSLTGMQGTLASVSEAKDRAAEGQREAERERDAAINEKDDAEQAQRDAEEALTAAQANTTDLEAQLADAQEQISSLEAKFSTLISQTGATYDDVGAQPLIEGLVIKADYSIAPGLLAINRGSDDGVKPGYVFEVYRDATYKGQARVQTVRPEMCSALILFTAEGTTVGQGDSVSTQIN